MEMKNGNFYIGGIAVAELAAKYGTPTYVYDEQKIRANYRKVNETFRKYYPNFEMFYAVKSCNNPAIVNILRQEGAGADCASVNEILLAKSVGLEGEKVMFSGNFLSDDDIKQGLESGVIFNLDDISLLPRLLKFGKPELLSFRVNPGYGKSNVGEYVTNAGPNAKFGIHPDKVIDAYRMAKEAGIKRFGAHMMTGSCITDAEYFPFVTGLLMDIIGKVSRELDINFEFVDLGGGLGIPYKPDQPANDIAVIGAKVKEAYEEILVPAGMGDVAIFTELGEGEEGDEGEESDEEQSNDAPSNNENQNNQNNPQDQPPQPSDNPMAGGNKFEPNNQVIDGNKFYGDELDAYYRDAALSLLEDENSGLSEAEKDLIKKYFGII